jgi:FkbM family methyltransferase
LDIGAHTGAWSQELLQLSPDSRVYAIEPHPLTYSRLKENLKGVPQCQVFQLAISDHIATIKLFDQPGDGSEIATLHPKVLSGLHAVSESISVTSFEVAAETLDHFTERLGIEQIDLLKIDTEGHELSVLRGATRLLRESRIKTIQFEFNEMNVMSKVHFADFFEILRDFSLSRILPYGEIPLRTAPFWTEVYSFQNVVARRNSPKH